MEDKEVHDALKVIIENKSATPLNYCINYACSGLSMTGKALHVQVLYILNNMTHWRGEVAKEVRATLKAYAKVK